MRSPPGDVATAYCLSWRGATVPRNLHFRSHSSVLSCGTGMEGFTPDKSFAFRKISEMMKMLEGENISWPAALAAPLSTLSTVGTKETIPVVSPGNMVLLYPRVTKDFLQLFILPLME